ncbi:hypothetical protein KR009_010855 [Drosophila setifemur]|nr:hypothetical protein KR009_010855 [Drosophila setifemur]
MLYYLVKFVKLCVRQPLKMLAHFKSLRKEWRENRIACQVSDVAYVSCWGLQVCSGPHRDLEFKCSEIYCFNNHIGLIIKYMNNAKLSIIIAIYAVSSEPICEALRLASERGVCIRMICEKNFLRMIDKNADCMLVRKLPPPKFETCREMMMHHKFCVIDGYQSQKELLPPGAKPVVAISMSGSLNWVAHAKSCDDMLITSTPKVAKRLEQEFDRIWRACSIPTSGKRRDQFLELKS